MIITQRLLAYELHWLGVQCHMDDKRHPSLKNDLKIFGKLLVDNQESTQGPMI
jgi:hypothetical protein